MNTSKKLSLCEDIKPIKSNYEELIKSFTEAIQTYEGEELYYTKIIILTGGTGTIGKAILRTASENESTLYIYTTRECNKEKQKNVLCFQCDFKNIEHIFELYNLIEYIGNIYKKEIIIINSAADKDASFVKNTFTQYPFNLPDNSKQDSTPLKFNSFKVKNNQEIKSYVNIRLHWTINVVYALIKLLIKQT